MIIFENKGEMDLSAAMTFGISAKSNDDAIGFFGTGLKYAMAILCREGIKAKFLIGNDSFDLSTSKTISRGKEFDIVSLGSNLGFTTLLGQNWELWQAFREIYCNTMDEGGKVYQSSTPPNTTEGMTYIIVYGDEFTKLFNNLDDMIIRDEPLIETKSCDIHQGQSTAIYYRSIKVLACDPSMYKYNIKNKITLTEDRTVKYNFEVDKAIAECVVTSTNSDFIHEFLTREEGTFERGVGFCHVSSSITCSEAFLEAASNLVNNIGVANPSAMEFYKKITGSKVIFDEIEITSIQKKQLDKAIQVCKGLGCNNINSYPIICCEALGDNILGLAKNSKIYLSSRVFNMGSKAVASTLFEEYVHLKHGLSDNTYEMQTYLFDFIMGIYEENRGEAI